MKKLFLLIGILTLVLVFYGFQKQKQQIQPEKYEAEVRLVLVDVIVTKDGKFVKDLTKDDFELYEDGKRVPINSFELISFEERELKILREREEAQLPDRTKIARPRKILVVLFDGINTWNRELKVQSNRIVDELLSVVKLGNEVMVCQLSKKGMEILQSFTSDEELIRNSVEKASGYVWNFGSGTGPVFPQDSLSQQDRDYHMAGIMTDNKLKELNKFVKTIGGILGTINMIKGLPGRKSVLFISSGFLVETSQDPRYMLTVSGIFDPFNILKKKVFANGGEVMREIINFANTQNISFYTLNSDIFVKHLFSGASAEHSLKYELSLFQPFETYSRFRAQNLEWLSETTGGDSFQGAKKFEQFRQVMNTDLTYYYEMSFYPQRPAADDKYHEITVKVKRPDVDVRHRKGYTDYTKETSNNMSLVTTFYNPSLFTDLPFEAEFVPFYADSGKYEPWINIALPTKEIFIDRFVEYAQKHIQLHIWINDNISGEKGYGGNISLPFDINQDFMDYIKTVDYLSYHFKGPELNLKQKEYQTVFSLVDSETDEVGAWESVINLPDLKESDSGAFINCVLGYIKTNPKKGPDSFSLSKDDGSLEYGNIKFFPKVINVFKQSQGAHIFMQVYLPGGKKDISPDFKILGKDKEIQVIEKELAANSFNEDTRIWSGLYFLDLSRVSSGENTLYVEIPGPKGTIRSHDLKLTVIRESEEDKIDKPKSTHPISIESEAAAKSKDRSELEKILGRCAEYCENLASTVLHIVCKERISEVIYGSRLSLTGSVLKITRRIDDREREFDYRRPELKVRKKKIRKSEYVYDYQLIRKTQKIKEQRVLIKENGKERNKKNAKLKTRFRHEFMILGPLGLLSDYWQPYHDYRIADRKKLWGKEAIIIEAVPKPESKLKHLWGKIWVSKDDYSILKIEWDQSSIGGYKSLGKNAVINLATEYKFEKKGIRFPSLYTLEENYVSAASKKFTASKIRVVYDNYKFFTVETEIKYGK